VLLSTKAGATAAVKSFSPPTEVFSNNEKRVLLHHQKQPSKAASAAMSPRIDGKPWSTMKLAEGRQRSIAASVPGGCFNLLIDGLAPSKNVVLLVLNH